MNIKFAFALNSENEFANRHFGDSDKFIISEWTGNGFTEFVTEKNTFKDSDDDDHEHHHGDKKKGQQIIKFLKGKNVKVLMSKQFGKNIKIINQHFIPVITSSADLDHAMQKLPEHISTIVEQLEQEQESYKLVDLRE
jgi:predicted Fe-Mo cluster-binding NifX family protein